MTLRGEMILGSVALAVAIAVGCTSNDVSPGGAVTTSGSAGPVGSGSGATGSGSGAGGSGAGFGANDSGSTSGGTVTVTEVQVEADNAANCPATEPAEGSACMILNDCAYDATGDLCVCSAMTWTCATQQTEQEDDQPFGGMGMGMFGGDGGTGGDGGNGGNGGNGGASTTGDTTTDGGAGAPPDSEVQCPEAVPTSGDSCPGALDCAYADSTSCSCRFDGDTWFCETASQ